MESIDEIEMVPCIYDTVKKFRIVVSMIEPRSCPLSPHNFFKMLNFFYLINRRHFEIWLFVGERPWFKEDVKRVDNIKKVKLLPFNIPKLSFTSYREGSPSHSKPQSKARGDVIMGNGRPSSSHNFRRFMVFEPHGFKVESMDTPNEKSSLVVSFIPDSQLHKFHLSKLWSSIPIVSTHCFPCCSHYLRSLTMRTADNRSELLHNQFRNPTIRQYTNRN